MLTNLTKHDNINIERNTTLKEREIKIMTTTTYKITYTNIDGWKDTRTCNTLEEVKKYAKMYNYYKKDNNWKVEKVTTEEIEVEW